MTATSEGAVATGARTGGGSPPRGLRLLGAWPVVARTETRLLLRDKIAAMMGLFSPLAFGLLIYVSAGDGSFLAGTPEVAAAQLLMVLTFSVYVTTTMTLASRRQHLYLKRLRSSPASTAAVVAGLATPLAVLAVLQVGLLWGASAAGSAAPTRPALLVVAVLVGIVTCAALAFLTAAYTRTSEAAQLTTMPVFLVLMAGMVWVLLAPAEQVNVLMLAVPGGAVAQLTRLGWGEPVLDAGLAAAAGPPVLIAAATAAVACLVAARRFRWEPRT